MRINKFLAECGVASRRACDKLIESGAVLVNGKKAAIGDDVSEKDEITVDGQPVKRKLVHSYYIMNKPKGYVCTVKDDKDRKTVMSLLPEGAGRVYPVGRLDYDTEGLLLFTDDGDLAFRLTHPKSEIPKTYLVRIEGAIGDKELNRLRAGVELDGKLTGKSKVKVIETDKQYTKLHVTINEGRNRQVRRMFECVGKQVDFLKRIRIGDLGLGSLARGKVRRLSDEEVFYLSNL
ncbi:MAG TPA: rRNA pseudouridine synthase [Candidatus Borkfalkia faecipullorum]|uniref:Pseudouridine synthase n=1 Tax=Candidatus Borkfalkia faecipullorum TaxID=2838510 RepID=A0A9D2AFR3_9FIRM|nr:rRNA pseudouridine synthase [Candidatus Borkfalkia faecipullorum]